MPRFGVFFVPAARSPFYRLATSIIGYDARRDQFSYPDNPIRAQIPNFDEEWVKRPAKHGIHCTIVAPQSCRYGDLDAINHDIETILNCFARATVFEMSATQDFVSFWGKKQQIAVLKYAANPNMLILHTLLVSQLAKYVMPVTELPTQEALHEYHRIKNFNSPFVFDGFTPHFTLLFPYKGDQHDDLQRMLYSVFGPFKQQLVDSICLMTQADKNAQWTIHKEYHLLDYPQQPE